MRYKSRADKRVRKKRANIILNSLIVVVLGLIVFTGYNIVFNEDVAIDSSESASKKEPLNEKAGKEEVKETESDAKEKVEMEVKEETQSPSEEAEKTDEVESGDSEQEIVISENNNDPNVEDTYVNNTWKPIPTSQEGEHVSSYEVGSIDWQEKEKAIALGANLPLGDMTVWYIGNGGGPNKAIGTVTSSNEMEIYRVYIEWMDGQGWKPTKVDRLLENDKKTNS
ncbi:YrrS family protein [Bacillus sp. 2205SS5-2]|uniref:YrrS family protein n=1 Tax=Bacillus sp. 2205SS5-2 TaxID=3109031 RepID=UPI003006E4A0